MGDSMGDLGAVEMVFGRHRGPYFGGAEVVEMALCLGFLHDQEAYHFGLGTGQETTGMALLEIRIFLSLRYLFLIFSAETAPQSFGFAPYRSGMA